MKNANLHGFYRYINKKLVNHTSLGEMQCHGKSFTTGPGAIANIFNDYFASVFTTDDGIIPYFCSRANTHLDRIDFTQEIVAQALKNLNNSTSTGPEGISNILLKKYAYSLAIPLTYIFDMSLKTCKLPDEWKTAPITPYSQGPTSLPTNYRLISFTCTCCRVMEKMVNKKLLT